MEIIGFFFSIWLIGTIIAWPYFWFKKGHRGQDAFERRLTSLGHGCAWPYYVVTYFTNQKKRDAEAAELEAQKRRILSGDSTPGTASGTAQGTAQPPASGNQIRNPFEDA